MAIYKIAGLVLTVACWLWARDWPRSDAWNLVLIWGSPLLTYPVTLLGLRILNARPDRRRTEALNVGVHYAMMIALGAGVFAALRTGTWPGPNIALPRPAAPALFAVTSAATALTVVNLAVRGLGLPFAGKLSSRLATDWMYAWTRNPMLLCTLFWFVSIALLRQSVWFLLWVLVDLSPGWVLFVKVYEERELSIRFGPAYDQYRSRTPFMWPRRPSPPEKRATAQA